MTLSFLQVLSYLSDFNQERIFEVCEAQFKFSLVGTVTKWYGIIVGELTFLASVNLD